MQNYTIEQRDDQLLGTTANIRYHLYFDKAAQHSIRVELHIDNVDEHSTALVMPSWMPGSYKIREMVAHQGNVIVTDASGTPLQWKWTSKNRILVSTESTSSIRLYYTYFANERGVRTSHVNRFHAYIMPVACLMFVEGRIHEIHHVYFHHDRSNWRVTTSQLSPVKNSFTEDEPLVLGALNYDIIADSPIEIGNHSVRYFDIAGAKHELAIMGNQNVDIDWLVGEIHQIVETERIFWGELPYDRYVFMLLVGEGQRGGLEHARSNVSAVDPSAFSDKTIAQGMLTLLVHEYFHTWNVKRIRPEELGPFDYSNENYTTLLWLAEGFTSYYDDLLTYRCGFYTRDEYLNVVSEQQLARLERVPGRLAMSVNDSSFLSWVKLYSLSPDMNNRFPSYYLKGGIVTMLLDMWIIAQTNGTYRLDNAMRTMWELYKNRPERGLSEDEIINCIEFAVGVKIREKLQGWMSGTEELPYNEILQPFGLVWASRTEVIPWNTFGENRPFAAKKSPVFLGVSLREEQGRIIVREVEVGTPAERAGFGIDDEILCVNGRRVTSPTSFMQEMQSVGVGKSGTITALCDGTLYETSLQPEPAFNKALIQVTDMSETQKRLLEYWLKR